MLLLIALSAFLAATLAVLAAVRRAPSPIELRAEALRPRSNAFVETAAPLHSRRRVSPLAAGAIAGLRWLFPRRWYARLEKALIAAGDPVDPGLFLLLWAVLGAGLPLLGALYVGRLGFLLGFLLGAVMPYMWLRRRLRTRRRRISMALPDALDLLVACVEAGLGLDAALIRVAEASEGPLGEELRLALGEIAVGRPRQEALFDLVDRTGVADLDGFLRPVVQAERLGVAIADSLRVQAESLRERRRQRAKEHAEKLPAKMVFPMVGFFIPAVMIVGVGMAVFSLINTFSNLGIAP